MPASEKLPHDFPVSSGKEIGSRLKFFLEKFMGCNTIAAAAEKLSVPRSTLDRWTKGDWISKEGLTALSAQRCNLHWLLTGWGAEIAPIHHPDYFTDVEFERDELFDDLNNAKNLLLEQGKFLEAAKRAGAFTDFDYFMFKQKGVFPSNWTPPTHHAQSDTPSANALAEVDKKFIERWLHIQKGIATLVEMYLSENEENRQVMREEMSQLAQGLLDRLASGEG